MTHRMCWYLWVNLVKWPSFLSTNCEITHVRLKARAHTCTRAHAHTHFSVCCSVLLSWKALHYLTIMHANYFEQRNWRWLIASLDISTCAMKIRMRRKGTFWGHLVQLLNTVLKRKESFSATINVISKPNPILHWNAWRPDKKDVNTLDSSSKNGNCIPPAPFLWAASNSLAHSSSRSSRANVSVQWIGLDIFSM